MHSFKFKWLFLLALAVYSCKPDDSADVVIPPDFPEPEVPVVIPDGDEQYLDLNSDYIFDQEKLHIFNLIIPPASLAKIDDDPVAEEYVEGSLIFEGDTISPVGVRYKGSIGAFVGCLSGQDWANPSGHKTCTKLSMKIKINWEGREERFYGLKKLQFHSMNLDPSQMRDRLGYWLFREMGVPAPRAVHARLNINGEYSGLYSLVEQIDGRFTRYNFDDGSGNLYKEIWPLQMNGQPHSEQKYISALRTNEDENPSVELIRTFAQEIAVADESNVPSLISNWMNVDEIIAYAVVDRTIKVDDGAFHWYCEFGDCSPHNFYWYENPSAETLHLIPWDMDNTFENIISNVNPVTPIADGWGETRNNCQPFNYGLFQISQWSAACDKLTAGWVSFSDEYGQALLEFKNGPLSEAEANARLAEWKIQIQNATIEAKDKHGDAISVAEWEGAFNQLKQQIEFARNN